MRVFLDANVLFSACRGAGAVRALLQLLEEGSHALVADAYVAEEARRNLAAKSGEAGLSTLQALLGRLELAGIQHAPSVPDEAIAWLVAKDQPVLQAAVALRCDALVTGDKTHFGSHYGKRVGGVLICSPVQLYQRIIDTA